jgi:hypothetical protein
MHPLLFFSILSLILAGIFLISNFETSAYAVNPTFNATKGYQYIANQYNATYGLVRESETIPTYWLWTDNLLASEVLKDYDYQMSANITSTIKVYTSNYDLDYRHPQGVLFDNVAYFNGVTNKQVNGAVWYSDSDGQELSCGDYADIAFLKSMYLYKAGKFTDARTCYDMGASMFDGIGMRDSAFNGDGQRYSTYKLALWQVASNVTGYPIPKEPMTIIPFMQNQTTGGVYTHYRADLTPDSLTNVETTSLVILAEKGVTHEKPAAIATESQNPDMTKWLVGAFVVAGFSIILFKRRR